MKSFEFTEQGIWCIGNGRMAAYGQGVDIFQILGPQYSSPSMFGVYMFEPYPVKTSREKGAAIMHHTISLNDGKYAEITDFISQFDDCLIREINTESLIEFNLVPSSGIEIIENTTSLNGSSGAYAFKAPVGTHFYSLYVIPKPYYTQITIKGNIKIKQEDDKLTLIASPGTSILIAAGGPDYPDALTRCEKALLSDYEKMYEDTQNSWRKYSAVHQNICSKLDPRTPYIDEITERIDDTAVLIKAQQSDSGGVLAGYNYHLAYVRDQYGTMRGMMAMGHFEEVAQNLRFYYDIWQKHGHIQNAQTMGIDGVFHMHEYDGSEITGYLILQAIDYSDKTGNYDLFKQISPMLEWAWETQKSCLQNNMMPFNGDETYIAGGIYPRSMIHHGSAEATLLMIESGMKLSQVMLKLELWKREKCNKETNISLEVSKAFEGNFLHDGLLYANNPNRQDIKDLTRFRHGVCEGCYIEFGWQQKNDNGRYLCPKCFGKITLPDAPKNPMLISSIALMPLYINSECFDVSKLKATVDAIAQNYLKTGLFSSAHGDNTVGYDYGFLLYALTKMKHSAADHFARICLDMADTTGAWVEYYIDAKHPSGTRCRPWESGINIEALIHWAKERQS